MTEPLRLTIDFEDGQDGRVIARVREVPAAMSQGRTRDEARENVLDALSELAKSYFADEADPQADAESERVEVGFA